MRPSPSIYLDTSFFTGLLENEEGRQGTAKAVLRHERSLNAKFHTSFLTLNEFAVRYYDKYRKQSDCEQRVNEAIASIRNIAKIHGIDDDIAKDSARIMSTWGEIQNLKPPNEPRDRKHRWDSIHLATANIIKVDRAYAFDGRGLWVHFPKAEVKGIGEIISPAKLPDDLFTLVEQARSEKEEPVKTQPEGEITVPAPMEALRTGQPIVVSSLEGYTPVTDGEEIETPEKPKATDESGPQPEATQGPKTRKIALDKDI
jgi:predicted nucleic acid-binding protein